MAEIRLRIAKDKTNFLKLLAPMPDETEQAPFKNYAAAVAFAAAYGAMNDNKSVINTKSSEIEPIRSRIFYNQDLNFLIELLALYKHKDPNVLASTPEAEEIRIKTFEEYANGGFELLLSKCEGKVDVLDAILLIIKKTESKDDDIASISDMLI